MKSSQLDIEIKPLSSLRIDKFEVLKKIGNGEYFKDPLRPSIMEKVRFLSEYTGVREEHIKQVSVESINNACRVINETIASYKPTQPKKEIVVNSKKYTFVGSFDKMSAAWHELVRQSDYEENPIRMASLCYIEKGMDYAELGKNDTIKNPTSKRDEVFKEHLPLDQYLDLNAVFLLKYREWHASLTVLNQMRKMKRLDSREENQ